MIKISKTTGVSFSNLVFLKWKYKVSDKTKKDGTEFNSIFLKKKIWSVATGGETN